MRGATLKIYIRIYRATSFRIIHEVIQPYKVLMAVYNTHSLLLVDFIHYITDI
jgi:hypothetical protein